MADLTNFLDKAYEGKDFAELAESPVDALQGLSKADAEALEKALGIKTVHDLATNKFRPVGAGDQRPGTQALTQARTTVRCVCISRTRSGPAFYLSADPRERQSVNRPRRAANVTASVRLAAPSLVMMDET